MEHVLLGEDETRLKTTAWNLQNKDYLEVIDRLYHLSSLGFGHSVKNLYCLVGASRKGSSSEGC